VAHLRTYAHVVIDCTAIDHGEATATTPVEGHTICG